MKTVADKKKGQNIGEYIIYMYQMENLLRAYQFEMEEVKRYVISHYPISEEEKAETTAWFAEIAKALKNEGKEEKGRLNSTQVYVTELAKIHWELLKTDKNYFEHYRKAKPHILQLVIEAGDKAPSNEVQVCLNAIYGLLLAKLKGRDVPKDMENATEAFGNVLSYLNWAYFHKNEKKIREN
ncbi:DUF4924 family protein [Cecembia sp.]|uniref:DUF4924 family protein n=1 Tax=Cecembia sp. TaxID=1898110 RepID=UPI0025C4AA63|nr:DUF4924 family protein [Cecembia sp.]